FPLLMQHKGPIEQFLKKFHDRAKYAKGPSRNKWPLPRHGSAFGQTAASSGALPRLSPVYYHSKMSGNCLMRTKTFAAAGAALALSAAVGFSATRSDTPAKPKGPLTSQLNRPWPAKVQTKQPQFPPTLTPAQEIRTFHMAPGFQVQLVASEPLVVDPIVAEF